jgi:hypothetical protein
MHTNRKVSYKPEKKQTNKYWRLTIDHKERFWRFLEINRESVCNSEYNFNMTSPYKGVRDESVSFAQSP